MTIDWEIKKFKELNSIKLYNIMRLRAEVFVIEQKCLYQDADGKDVKAFHLSGYDSNGNLVAYARILPAGVSFKEVSIGRIVVPKKLRKKEIGNELMLKTLDVINKIYGNIPVRINAQSHLKNFYSNYNFDAMGKEYLEDDIPHIEMLKPPGIPH